MVAEVCLAVVDFVAAVVLAVVDCFVAADVFRFVLSACFAVVVEFAAELSAAEVVVSAC